MSAWERRGRLYAPQPGPAWRRSHAANPTAVPTRAGWRIFFSPRDAQNRSHVAAADFAGAAAPREAARVGAEPVLTPGAPGSFDQHGATAGCLSQDGNRLYYLAWNLDGPGRFNNTIGLAVRGDDGSFSKASDRPMLGLSEEDPHSLSYPWVLEQTPGWQLWYGSTVEWLEDGDMRHVLRRAVSQDGLRWTPTGGTCLEADGATEWALSRPCVLASDGRYRMWFSARGARYRIGYAESHDGVHWQRDDSRWGLGPTAEASWESEEVAYPCVCAREGRLYLFYCGNGYGRTGFGWAVADDPWAD